MSLLASIAGIAIWGPGLEGWDAAIPVLRGTEPLEMIEQAPPPPAILAANERRRSGLVVRLALEVAQRATAMAGLAPDSLRCVFGSANGDGAVIDAILETLAQPGADAAAQLSPTQFHNSVHNAAAGYWTIAAGSRQPATCLGCHDATFAAALLKAMSEVVIEQAPVLLCLYDARLPPPIAPQRPTEGGFAAAFVLVPGAMGPLATLEVAFSAKSAQPADWEPTGVPLRKLAHSNPAARSLRLLEVLANRKKEKFAAELLDGSVTLSVTPCSTAVTS